MVSALLGGALIGLAASTLLLLDGRVMGASGIVGGLLKPAEGEVAWRLAFLGGTALAGLVSAFVAPGAVGLPSASPAVIVAAGLLVGFGTQLGNGCTSGHGVCGLSRRSPRSLVNVITFLVTGAVVVAVIGLVRGAA